MNADLLDHLLDHLLTADPTPAPLADIGQWQARHSGEGSPVQIAVRGGFAADRLGYAFASGYQAACRRLLPDAPAGWLLALCATESGGGHPRAIQTTLRDGVLTGDKRFVSMGTLARGLLVVASQGHASDGRPRLVVALVDAQASGVRLAAQPPLPFIPEVPHATLTLEAAPPLRLLEGDGYADHLKPFRTIEDIHVHAALVAWLVQVGRRIGWGEATIEALLGVLCGLSALSPLDARSRGVHRALGGILARLEALLADLDLSAADEPTRRMWARDAPLLQIAQRARAARLHSARTAHA